jgi:hypothetical protein
MHPVRAGTEIILGLRQKCLFEFRRTRNDAQSFGSGVEAQYQFNGWRKPPLYWNAVCVGRAVSGYARACSQ